MEGDCKACDDTGWVVIVEERPVVTDVVSERGVVAVPVRVLQCDVCDKLENDYAAGAAALAFVIDVLHDALLFPVDHPRRKRAHDTLIALRTSGAFFTLPFNDAITALAEKPE
jgi:hypothetical protein